LRKSIGFFADLNRRDFQNNWLLGYDEALYQTKHICLAYVNLRDYDDYKSDMVKVMQILKENRWIAQDPIIKTYGLNTIIYIKDFKFAPITHKIVGCDFWVKKLLNI